MSTIPAELLSVTLLLLILGFAVVRPRQLPEAVVAVPAAAIVVAVGAVSPAHAWAETQDLLPVVGFLAAVLVLAQLCADEGLFKAAGDAIARACKGSPRRMLGGVFAAAAVITAVLSLDATVVLLTPVVLATARRIGARPRPHVYASAHLANSASLLLPVSNLTNLLAFTASGLTFARFAGLMALPWLGAIAVEYVVFRRYFADDLAAPAHEPDAEEPPGLPVFTLTVLALTLVGFVVTSFAGIDPLWAAIAGDGRPRGAGAGAAAHDPARAGEVGAPVLLPLRPRARDRGQGGRRQRARGRHRPAAARGLVASRAARRQPASRPCSPT